MRSRGVEDARAKLFSGEKVNFTEVKTFPVFHLVGRAWENRCRSDIPRDTSLLNACTLIICQSFNTLFTDNFLKNH